MKITFRNQVDSQGNKFVEPIDLKGNPLPGVFRAFVESELDGNNGIADLTRLTVYAYVRKGEFFDFRSRLCDGLDAPFVEPILNGEQIDYLKSCSVESRVGNPTLLTFTAMIMPEDIPKV